MKELAKSVLEKSKSYVYHKEQNALALKVRKVLENQNGKLSDTNVRLCNEYALDVFEDKKYAPWLMAYCAYSNEFKEGWIPDNYYGETVIPALKGQYGKVCDRTLIINKLLNQEHSLDLGYFINGHFLDVATKKYNPKDFADYIFKENKKVVFKTETSFQGRGIYIYDKNSFNEGVIKKLGNGVFQSFIIQHDFFNQFNDTAVGTIRITSVCNQEGDIEIRAGFFKFGRPTDKHVKSSSAIKIPFNVTTGQLYHKAFLPDNTYMDTLPDNAISFANLQLPNYDQCISEIKKLHKSFFYIGSIGWDVTIDNNNNLRIIELNGSHNGIKFNEMVQGPCFTGLGWEKLHKDN